MDPADWEIVKSTPLFGAMSSQTAEVLVGNTVPRLYEKGTTLFLQGEPATAFFIVLDGWVKIYRTTPDGLEVVLHVFKSGETFAEAAIFLGGRYPASGETVSPSRLLKVDGSTFRARIEERPEQTTKTLMKLWRDLEESVPAPLATFLTQHLGGEEESLVVGFSALRIANVIHAALEA